MKIKIELTEPQAKVLSDKLRILLLDLSLDLDSNPDFNTGHVELYIGKRDINTLSRAYKALREAIPSTHNTTGGN